MGGLVEDDAAFPRAAPVDHGNGAGLTQLTAERVGVMALVSQEVSGAPGAPEQRGGDGDVGDVARRQGEGEGRPMVSVSRRRGGWRPSARAWILVVRPPRDGPIACVLGPVFRRTPVAGP